MNSSSTRTFAQDPPRTMDIVREKRRGLPKGVAIGGGVAVLVILAVISLISLTRSHGGGAVIDGSTIVRDVVKRGTLVRSVTAQGTFVPDRVRIASATQGGVVNQVFVKPGAVVAPGTIIAQMQNPALQALVESEASQVAVARANLESAIQQARASHLSHQTALADAQAQLEEGQLQAKSYQALHTSGLVSDIQYRQAQIDAKKLDNDARISRAQVTVDEADAQAKVAAAQAQVSQVEAQLGADSAQVAELTIRAASGGIVQSVEVDPGVSVSANTVIARVADTTSLKAVLQVAEGDVHPVLVGMPVNVDTGNGVIVGHVARIAPSAQNGTVAVDVTFNHALPSGARPDANVDGTVEISSIPNALSVARPAGALDGNTIDLFKVVDNGTRAVRVRVKLGQGSNDRVAVLDGLAPGDTVIVSDMSTYLDQPELSIR